MNGRQLSDAQISRALQAHLPERAAAGLRERVLDAAGTTTQQRPLPSFLGALTDADPVARRTSLLIAAALLLGLLLASAAAAGGLRLLDSIRDVSLEPPADLPAFVLSSYERLPQLPSLALTWHEDGSDKGRVYVDRSGAVRFDRFASAQATEPSSYTILQRQPRERDGARRVRRGLGRTGRGHRRGPAGVPPDRPLQYLRRAGLRDGAGSE